MPHFNLELADNAAAIERALDALLTAPALGGPGVAPHRLIAAMRHGSLAGGKRLRPLLVRQSAAVFGVAPLAALTAGLAIELVHCYSLIHDDLPAMDDDDLRRGRPTVHKAFDDATAILAGDALLTHAFGLLADPAAHPDAEIRVGLVADLAAGAGAAGMAGGQARDLEGERSPLDAAAIARMQAMKTGALIRAAVRMGARLGGASEMELAALTRFAELAGRAFQLADDLLDVTSSPATLGKATQKDHARQKQTLVATLGLDAARAQLTGLVDEAVYALQGFDTAADGLRETARYFADREH